MSYYDDASIMFVGGAATGVDGKAGTAKPINGGSPLYVTRGSNLTATRVDSNGLIEKGRENLAKNTNWEGASLDTAPTDYTSYLLSNGTFNTTSTEGQIRFTTDSSSRAMIYTSTISETGIFTQSVYVDEVYASLNITSVINVSAGATAIAYYEDGVEITSTTNVQAGKRYSILWNKTGGSSFRFGSGVNGQKVGDIVLSRPQIEQGLVATEHITSPIGSTGLAGLLENEPRFNYPIGGSVPHLLLEPQRTNLIETSEYFEGSYWGIGGSATRQLRTSVTAPDGSNAVYLLSGGGEDTSDRLQNNLGDITANGNHIFSVFVKGTGVATQFRLRNNSGAVNHVVYDIDSSGNFTLNSQSARDNYYGAEDYGNGWHRVYLKIAPAAGDNYFQIFPDILDANGSVYIWGAQACVSEYITSYIPNHSGGSVTRESESYQNSDIDAVTNMSTDECTVLLDVDFPQGREGSSRFIQFVDIAGGGSTYFGLKSQGNYVPAPIIQLVGGGTINTSSTHSLSVGRHKIAIRWLSGTATVYIDGAEVSTLSVTDSAAPTSFDKVFGSGAPYRHFVHELIVFESGWDNVDLEILTGVTGYESFAAMAATLNYTVYE